MLIKSVIEICCAAVDAIFHFKAHLEGACVEPRILKSISIWVSVERAWKDELIDTVKCVLALLLAEKKVSTTRPASSVCWRPFFERLCSSSAIA